ncbi:MAG: serine/threonine-protein phosphatase [Myxococcales bacterium]|nr:serine/threonine-protein phosphatase [Myxococcales bacterium]
MSEILGAADDPRGGAPTKAFERQVGVRGPSRSQLEGAFGSVVAHAEPAPHREPDDVCQDSTLVVPTDDGLVLAVADGVGGSRGGAEASRLAMDTLFDALTSASEAGLREVVMDAFEKADAAAQASTVVGSTTLLVAEVQGGVLRTYNTGDSEALVVGGRGKIKLRTVSHSPVGYQVAAGVLDAEEALHHDMRHYISNAVGTGEMRIDVGPSYSLAAHDTLVLGSDGLFDNVTIEEIAELVRRGPLGDAAEALVELARRRMRQPGEGEPSKPDDLSVVLFRPPRGRSRG